MNYIELINKFWAIDLEATFSHAEVHLYFKLLEINNKLGWKNEFKYPNARLEGETGMRSKTLINTRQRLIDCGVLFYKKGNTRNAGTYSFSPLLSKRTTKESNQESNTESIQPIKLTLESNQESKKESNQGNNREVIRGVIRGTLNKQNKTKQELKKDTKEKFDLSFVDVAFIGLVKDFISYRSKDLKKPFKTERGVKTFYNELLKISGKNIQKAKELVAYAKGKEWQTVYAITKDSKKHPFTDYKQKASNYGKF